METPLISIIVPIYNSESFLDKCIQSLLNQSLKEIEIILVDDASPDNSIEIMKKYAAMDDRVRIIRNKINGSPNPRNAGIMVAKAEYLGFVDADDWVESDMYERLYSASEVGNVDVVIGEYEWVYPNGKTIRDPNIEDRYITGDVKDVIISLAKNGGRLFTNIWKKNLILEDNLLFLEKNYYCDSIVATWYIKAQRIAKISKPFYKYRINSVSVTGKKDFEGYFDRLSSARHMLNKLKKLGLYNNYKDEIDFLFYRLFYLNTVVGCIKSFTKIPYTKIDEVKNEFNETVDISKNKYYRQVMWKKWNPYLRIIGYNTKLGSRIIKIAMIMHGSIKNIINK